MRCGRSLRWSMIATHAGNLLPKRIMATRIPMFGTLVNFGQLLPPISSFIGPPATAKGKGAFGILLKALLPLKCTQSCLRHYC